MFINLEVEEYRIERFDFKEKKILTETLAERNYRNITADITKTENSEIDGLNGRKLFKKFQGASLVYCPESRFHLEKASSALKIGIFNLPGKLGQLSALWTVG